MGKEVIESGARASMGCFFWGGMCLAGHSAEGGDYFYGVRE